MRTPPATTPDPGHVERVIDALLDPALEPIVDMVVTADADGYEAAAVDGRVRFRRDDDGSGWTFTEVAVEGRNPLGDQSTDRFSPLADERTVPHPTRDRTSYPFAYEMVAQLFDHPAAPDVVCQHTSAHNWEDHGGERGEHGSMGIVQARAPFVLAGAGVKTHGVLPRACKLVDVAPTVLALMGAAPHPDGVGLNGRRRDDALLRRQDGEVLADLIDEREPAPDHVVGILLDGCNANVLYDMAARGEAPNVARIMAMGTTMGHGAISSAPTVTLPNHTTILTGAHPGHHGVLNNAWWDRATGEQVITNAPQMWAWAMDHLSPEVETLYEAVHRTWPDAFTLAANEPCDRGADFGTFHILRDGALPDRPPSADELPFATERFVRPEKAYRTASRVDHTGLALTLGVWGDGYQGSTYPLPRFTWVNTGLTDAAMHRGGPYSEIAAAAVRDTDARIGEVLAAVERAGVFDRTAFLLVADHGMEDSNPEVTGSWGPALADLGVPVRDEAYMWIYTGVG